ncbi:pilus assembly protein [Rhodopirellula sp.]|nr:pilus assembly protein [Rhodopirellula sp.]
MNQFHRKKRSGQALIEFALVALVLYLIVGAALTFGLWLYAAGQIQQAANVGARELSQTPLPFDSTFETALDTLIVRQRIYDDRWLVIDLDQLEASNPNYNFFEDVVPEMPLLNQQLASLYIVDRFDHDNNAATSDVRLMRYPGALLTRTDAISTPALTGKPWVAQQYVVQIPIVVERTAGHSGGGGGERIRWVNVVEEIDTEGLPDEDSGENPDPFSLENSNTDMRGVVALRIHYPAQSAWLSSYQDRGPFVINTDDPNVADDAAVVVIDNSNQSGSLIERPLTGTNASGDSIYAGTYGGKYGLGIHGAMTSPQLTGSGSGIRPYRRVLVSHAIFRREVFTSSSP